MERAQQKVESRNFEIRKTLLKFDDVMNDQRQVIFGQRAKILRSGETSELIYSFLKEITEGLEKSLDKFKKNQDFKNFSSEIKENFGNMFDVKQIEDISKMDKKSMTKKIIESFEKKRSERIQALGEGQNAEIEKRIFLQILDFLWRSHLQYLEQLRQVIGLRSYGQKDPLSEFRKEAFELFENLLIKIKAETVKFLFNVNIVVENENKENEQKATLTQKRKKVPRNSPCTCGSGKKYKHCCGRAA